MATRELIGARPHALRRSPSTGLGLRVRLNPEPDLRRFFEDYKKNEKKEVVVDEIMGAEAARKAIADAMVSATKP